MALENMVGDLNDLLSGLPVEAVDKILDLVVILKALGIAAILYVVYVVVMGVFTYRRMKKVESIERKADKIDKKINSIDRKLNKILRIEKKK